MGQSLTSESTFPLVLSPFLAAGQAYNRTGVRRPEIEALCILPMGQSYLPLLSRLVLKIN